MKQQNPFILLNNLTADLSSKRLVKNSKTGLSANSQDFASLIKKLTGSVTSENGAIKKSVSDDVISNLKKMNFITESGTVNEAMVSVLPVDESGKKNISQFLHKIADSIKDRTKSKTFNSNIRSLSSSYAQMSSESVPQNRDNNKNKNITLKPGQRTTPKTESKNIFSDVKNENQNATADSSKKASVSDTFVLDSQTTVQNLPTDQKVKTKPVNTDSAKAKTEKTSANTEKLSQNNVNVWTQTSSNDQSRHAKKSEQSTDQYVSANKKTGQVKNTDSKEKNTESKAINKTKSQVDVEHVADRELEVAAASKNISNTGKENTEEKTDSLISSNVASKNKIDSTPEKTSVNGIVSKMQKVKTESPSIEESTAKVNTTLKTENKLADPQAKLNSTIVTKNENSKNTANITELNSREKVTGSASKSKGSALNDSSETYKVKTTLETGKSSRTVENTVDAKTGTILKTNDLAEIQTEQKNVKTQGRRRTSVTVRPHVKSSKHSNSVTAYLKTGSSKSTAKSISAQTTVIKHRERTLVSGDSIGQSTRVLKSKHQAVTLNSPSKSIHRASPSDNHSETGLPEKIAITKQKDNSSNKVPVTSLRRKTEVNTGTTLKQNTKVLQQDSIVRNTIVKTVLMRKAESASNKSVSKNVQRIDQTNQQNKIITGTTIRVFSTPSDRTGNTTARLSNVNMQAISSGLQNKVNNQSSQQESIITDMKTVHLSEGKTITPDKSIQKSVSAKRTISNKNETNTIESITKYQNKITRKNNIQSSAEKITKSLSTKQTNTGKTNTLNREPVVYEAKDSSYTKSLNNENIDINTKNKGVDEPQNFSKESKYSFDDSEVISPLRNNKSFTAAPKEISDVKMSGTVGSQHEKNLPSQEVSTKPEHPAKTQMVMQSHEPKNQLHQLGTNKVLKTEAAKVVETPKSPEQANAKENTSEPVAVKSNITNEKVVNNSAESKVAAKQEVIAKQETIKNNTEIRAEQSKLQNTKTVKTETAKVVETPKSSEQANAKENTSEHVAVKSNITNEKVVNNSAESKVAAKQEVISKHETIRDNTEFRAEQPQPQNAKTVKTETAKVVETPKSSEQANAKENTSEPAAVKSNITNEKVVDNSAESKVAAKQEVIAKHETIRDNTEFRAEQPQPQNAKTVKTETAKVVETPKSSEQANAKEYTSEPVSVKSNVTNEKVVNNSADKTIAKQKVIAKHETIKNNTEIRAEQPQPQNTKTVKTETAKVVETPKSSEQANAKEYTSEPVSVKSNLTNEKVVNNSAESKVAAKQEVIAKHETIRDNTEFRAEQPQPQNAKTVKTETAKVVETPKSSEQANAKENTSEPVSVKSNVTNEKVVNNSADKTIAKQEVNTKPETIKDNTEISAEQPQPQNTKTVKTETAKVVETPKNSEQANAKENTSEHVAVKSNVKSEKVVNNSADKTIAKQEVIAKHETSRNNTEIRAEQPQPQNTKTVKTETTKVVETPKSSEQANAKENTSEPDAVKSNITNEKVVNNSAESKVAAKQEVNTEHETVKDNTEIKTEQTQPQNTKTAKTETAKVVETPKNSEQANAKENTSEPVAVKSNITNEKFVNNSAESKIAAKQEVNTKPETIKDNTEIRAEQANAKENTSEPVAVKSNITNEKVVNNSAESKVAAKQEVIAKHETIKDNTDIKSEKSEAVPLKNNTVINDRSHESEENFQENAMVEKKGDKGYSQKADYEKKEISKSNPEKVQNHAPVKERYTQNESEVIADKRLFYNIQNLFHKNSSAKEETNRTVLKLDDEESITKFLNSLRLPDLEKLHSQKNQSTEPSQSNYVRRPEAKNESMENSSDNKNENYNNKQGNSENYSKNENEAFRSTIQDQQFDTAFSSTAAKAQSTVPSYNGTSINQIYEKIFNELKSFEINSKSSLFKEADFKLRTDDFGEITANLVKENNNLQVTISVKNEAHLQTLRDQLSDMNKSLEKLGFDEVEVNYRFDNEEHHNQHSHNRQRNIVNRQNAFHTLKEESETQQLMSMKRENTTIEYII